MELQSLDELVREYYSGQRLAPETLVRLRALAPSSTLESGDKKSAGRLRIPRGPWLAAAAAAAVLLALAVGLLVARGAWSGARPSPPSDLARLAALEIAVNHLKNSAVDFRGSTYEALSREMTRLGFELATPPRLVTGDYRVFGARYCSIQGQRAAQVKLRNEEGKVATLYQTPMSGRLAAVPPGKLLFDGIRVRIWRQEGLLFGFAESVDGRSLTGPPPGAGIR